MQYSLVIALGIITFLSTLLGGMVILKFKKYLPYFFAFAAGSLMAVAFLDILPESIKLAASIAFPIRGIMIAIVASFFFYSLLEKFFLTHHFEENEDYHGHIMGEVGASSLIIHSFLDGAAIGSAFQINFSTGIIVALAVIFHDFTDGINTVTIMLKNNHKTPRTSLFLILDALAPVLGVLVTSLIIFPTKFLAILLAVFVGEFIYIGASSLLPETHKYPSRKIILFVALGILLIALLTSFL